MVITYSNHNKLIFPVFPLLSSNYIVGDGLVTIDGLVVDDRNMEGETLGKRRLQTPFKSLFPLKKSVDNLTQLIKCSKKFFIDSAGIIFTYEKTKWVQLKYLKIDRIVKKETKCLLYFSKYKSAFIIQRPPIDSYTFAGVLHLEGDPWLLYDYANTKLKDTRRKV
jgi:hypothetical protein